MSNSPYLGHLRNEYSSSQLSFLDMFPLEIDYNASSFEGLFVRSTKESDELLRIPSPLLFVLSDWNTGIFMQST